MPVQPFVRFSVPPSKPPSVARWTSALLAIGCLCVYAAPLQHAVDEERLPVTTRSDSDAESGYAASFEFRQEQAKWQDMDRQASQLLQQGRYRDGLKAALNALSVAKATFGLDHPYLAEALNLVGAAYFYNGDYESSEKSYKESIQVQRNAIRAGHGNVPGLANELNNLGALYGTEGRYQDARPVLEFALEIGKQHSGPHDLANQLNSLGLICKNLGDYSAAESFYSQARDILENWRGPDDPSVAITLDNIAGVYLEEGRLKEGAQLRRKSLEILERKLPEDHPDVVIARHNMALIFEALQDYTSAERLLRKSIDLSTKTLGANHPDVIAMRDDMAELLGREHKYAPAEALFKNTQQLLEHEPGANRLNLARSLSKLAAMYSDQRRYAEAEKQQRRAMEIWEHRLPPGHPTLTTGQADLARIYFALRQPIPAEPLFEESIRSLKDLFDRQFAYMSESERLSFLKSVEPRFPLYLSFCFKFRNQRPGLVGDMYDAVLWEKGLVASSVAALHARLASRGDKEALSVLNQLMSRRTELAERRAAKPGDQAQKTIAYLEQEANRLERELVKRVPEEADKENLGRATWRDVQRALTEDEVAIEFVRFPFHDGRKWISKSYYVALILTFNTRTAPVLVLLGEANDLEGSPLNDYRKRVGLEKDPSLSDKPGFYAAFWRPLEKFLGGKKHIYLSPDGALNQVSLAGVSDDRGQLLIERYDLEILLSTRDLLRKRQQHVQRSAVLMGNPKFDLTEAGQRGALGILFAQTPKPPEGAHTCASQQSQEASTSALEASARDVARGILSRDVQTGPLDELPETATGIGLIRDLLVKQGWHVEVYTAECALEEEVKRVQGPRILHLATHGFFEPDQENERGDSVHDPAFRLEDPMLRSGLFFAGADRALHHETAATDLDDGVLTAYEATALDLSGTEIVTLSACDTGLGQVSGGEGVFGLRRAFAEAGAQSILMSMWEVPATPTQELMTRFYEGWLVSGLDKNEALLEAQREERKVLRARYGKDVPNYWAAWVLVGR